MAVNYNSSNTAFENIFIPRSYTYLENQYLSSGYLYMWGGNTNGALGDSTVVPKSSPIQIGSLTSWKNIAVTGDGNANSNLTSTATIKTDGTLWTWGDNTTGQLGDSTIVPKSSPIQVGALTDWNTISGGGQNFFIATKTDNTLWGWGGNLAGVLGQSDTASRSSPIQIGALTSWKSIAAGFYHMLGISTTGGLYACGDNLNGELGDSTTLNKSSPIQVGLLTNWKQVAAGVYVSASIKTDGTLWTWGNSAQGLGDGTILPKSSPIQIGILNNWNKIYINYTTFYSIKIDNSLWAWGRNANGQLGDSTIVPKSSPIQIGALTNWLDLSNSSNSLMAAAVKTDGTLWTWGYGGTSGALGNLTLLARSSPVQIGALTGWKKVAYNANFYSNYSTVSTIFNA